MSLRALATLALVTLALAAVPSSADAAPARRVYVGTYLHDVTDFDQRSGTYVVDIDVWAKWFGDFDAAALRVQNGSADVERDDLGESHDGDWHMQRWRVRGTLRGEFPLHRFPFDRQQIPVVFELVSNDVDLVPDLAASGMAQRFSITGWNYVAQFSPRVSRVVYASDMGTLANEGGSTIGRRVRFEVTLQRPTVTVAVKLFMPLLLLLLIAMLALFLGPELVDPRAAMGVTVLLACFAFQFTIAGTIPDVAYLTIVDSLFIVAYALTTLSLIVTVVVYFIHRHGEVARALRVDRFFRAAIPLAGVALSFVVLRPAAQPPRPPATVTAAATRAPSARSLLRIGTLRLPTPTPTFLRTSVRAGLVRIDPDGERRPELAEAAPSVSNDMLRFSADGRLEVRWHLREGLRWSDGHAITSDDFRFALEVSPDPHVVRIATPDARTLWLTYDDTIGGALEGLAPLPRHRLASSVRGDAGFEGLRRAQRTQVLPSAGPYRVVDFRADDHVVVEANRNYAGAAPAIRRIEVRRFASTEALEAAFLSGAIDIVVPNDLPGRSLARIEAALPGTRHVRASAELLVLVPDLSVPWLADLATRRAIASAIDRDALVRDVLGGVGSVAWTPLARVEPTELGRNAFDPARARAVFEAAGLVGRTLVVSHGSRKLDRSVALAVEAALEAAGLVVELREVADGDTSRRPGANGGLWLTSLESDDEADPRRYWNLRRVAGRFDERARSSAYDDGTANLVGRWAHAVYVERHHQLRDRLAAQVPERLPVLPLLFVPERVVATSALEGWDVGNRFGRTLPDWRFVTPSGTSVR